MTYQVRLIDEDQLPEDHVWAMVRPRQGDDCVLFVKQKHVTQREIDQTIEAFRQLDCSV